MALISVGKTWAICWQDCWLDVILLIAQRNCQRVLQMLVQRPWPNKPCISLCQSTKFQPTSFKEIVGPSLVQND